MTPMDDRYLLPSRAARNDTTKRMNAMYKDVYGALESLMLGMGPEHRVRQLRESVGASAPQMVGLAAMMEAGNE